ncbi:MAG: hypothetical protein MK077_03425 [Phycisphaerales bacterium]|nr:hypothetical protein [Phycisphaerales bacterium]
MNMKTIGVTGAFALATAATAGVTGISIDSLGDTGNGVTYQVFVDMTDDTRIDAVFGNSQGTLSIGLADASMSFYQNLYGNALSTGNNPMFYPLAPSLEYDSFVTIGALDASGNPYGSNSLLDIGIDFSGFEAGGGIETDNGSWFVTPADDQGNPIDGRVLIGQFTVVGGSGDGYADLTGFINVQGSDANGGFQEYGLNWIPAPGALALLGVAGLAGRRRRR